MKRKENKSDHAYMIDRRVDRIEVQQVLLKIRIQFCQLLF